MTQFEREWERLGEQGLNVVDECQDTVAEAFKRPDEHRAAGWRTLVESYVKSKLGIHFHVEIREGLFADTRRVDAKPRNLFCVLFDWPGVPLFKE